MDITVNSKWSNDCQGKQDLDFSIIKAFTRYYPDFSAICTIVFLDNYNYNTHEYIQSGFEPIELLESGFLQGESEIDVKAKVVKWYNENIIEAMEKALRLIKCNDKVEL